MLVCYKYFVVVVFVNLEVLVSVAIGKLHASVTAFIYATYSQNYMGGKQYSRPNSGKTS